MNGNFNVSLTNIQALNLKIRSLWEQYLAHNSELADALLSENPNIGIDEIGSVYGELKEMLNESISDLTLNADSSTRHFVKKSFENADTLKNASLCAFIAERTGFTPQLRKYDKDSSKISYFRNSYADIAYRKFAKLLPLPTVSYAENFSSVCEDVYSEKCDFCILPISSSADGHLSSFEKLIQKYELSPLYTCIIPTGTDDFIEFALLAADTYIPDNADFASITVFQNDHSTLASLLCATDYFGAVLTSCISADSSSYQSSYRLVFDISKADLNSLYVYLQLEFSYYLLGGIYRKLK